MKTSKHPITLFLLTLFLQSCSNIAFQPSKQAYYNPKSFGFEYKDIYLKSRDGKRLHGWLFPSLQGIENKGTIVHFHGNAENISTHFLSMAWVTKHGYDLFTFDYQGYGRSEGKAGHKRAHNDALAVIDYSLDLKKSQGDKRINAYKVVLYGQSIGGAILLRALADHKSAGQIDAMVIDSSFASYQDIAREKLALTCLTWPIQHLAYLLMSDRYAPEKFMNKIPTIPKIFIHGDNDVIVPFHHGERLFDLAKDPKQFWRIEGGRHISAMVQEDYKLRLIEYLSGL